MMKGSWYWYFPKRWQVVGVTKKACQKTNCKNKDDFVIHVCSEKVFLSLILTLSKVH